MNAKRLLNVLREVVEDKHIFRFIQWMGTVKFVIEHIGKTLRSNFLSCLLAGLYFHKLDGFVQTQLRESWFRRNSEAVFSINIKLKKYWFLSCFNTNVLNNIILYKENNKCQKSLIYPEVLRNKIQNVSSMNRSVYYVRHTSKIVFGINGLMNLASLVKKECNIFILNNLHFESKITNYYSIKADGVKYLGFVVKSFSCKLLINNSFLSFSRLKNKNQVFLREWQRQLRFNSKGKTFLRVSEIAGCADNKVLSNKIVKKVTNETLIFLIVKMTESIFMRYKKKKGPLAYHQGVRNRRLLFHWYCSLLFWSKYGWVNKDKSKNIFDRYHIVWDYCNKLPDLSGINKSKKVVLAKKNKMQTVKIKNVNEHLIIQAMNHVEPSIKLRLFISQNTVLHKMERWGIIDKKRNKPIACNYMDGKFVVCLKSKNVLLFVSA